MKPSEDLFQLIKSLSRNEKGYFKKFSQLYIRGGENKYVLLFDAIDLQKDYDEKELLEQFKNHDLANNFSVAKSYLYQQILYALELYHNSSYVEIYRLLHWTEILYEKGLYKQSNKMIIKAKQLSKESELHGLTLFILRSWEHKLAIQSHNQKWIQYIKEEEQEELHLLQNSKKYMDLFYTTYFHFQSHGAARQKKPLKAIRKIISNRMLSSESNAKTIGAKRRFNEIHFYYWLSIGNHKRAYSYIANIYILFNKHPKYKIRELNGYIFMLGNLCSAALLAKKYLDIPEYLNEFYKLESIKKSESKKITLFYWHKYNLLNFTIATGQFKKAAESLPEIIREIKQYNHKLNVVQKDIFFSSIAIVFFGIGQYNKSIFWLNRIRNEIVYNRASEIESFYRLLYLIVHYEAGHEDILPNLIQSAYRFLLKKKQLYKFEIIVIDFLRNRLPLVSSHAELINSFKKLKSQIAPLASNAYEKNAFIQFDFVSWLESKIENRSFGEIVKSRQRTDSQGEEKV